MLAIYKKEMKTYFHSIIGYVFIAFFLALIGLFVFFYNLNYEYADFSYTLYGIRMFGAFLFPIITMRLLAEENKQKTDQLLFTSPLSIGKIIWGKYLAVVSIYAIVMAVSCFYPLVLSKYGTVNFKGDYAAILAFFLLGCAYLAIGMFISAMTESQAFAAVITLIVILLTVFSSTIAGFLPTDNKTAWLFFALIFMILTLVIYAMMKNMTVTFLFCCISEIVLAVLYLVKPEIYDGSVVRVSDWFSVISRFDNFMYGILDVSAIAYYISISLLFVFLTMQVIKKRRWS
ncbi:MAG: ABC transporter [Lachnospiraceae bacterium]|nr:ABC transporter [Lachnospiraceae bacterium]